MSDGSGSQDNKRNRFLMNRPGQAAIAGRILATLTAFGLVYAVVLSFLVGSNVIQGATVAQMRLVLLGVHAAAFLVGGAVVLLVTLRLTHRYAGPALVMERALEQMRQGEYDGRLSTRVGDFHKTLTEKMRLLRDELRERDSRRAGLLERLEKSLDSGDLAGAKSVVSELCAAPAASPAREAAEAA